MKALVILQTILEDEEYEDMECVACGFTRTYLEKAISELKIKTQPKTCKSCKHFFQRFNEDGYLKYNTCDKLISSCSDIFYCSFYEPKK